MDAHETISKVEKPLGLLTFSVWHLFCQDNTKKLGTLFGVPSFFFFGAVGFEPRDLRSMSASLRGSGE
jgi:hypothetical protein